MSTLTGTSLETLDVLPEGFLLYSPDDNSILRIQESLEDGYAAVVVLTDGDNAGDVLELPEIEELPENVTSVSNAPTEVRMDYLAMRLAQVEQTQLQVSQMLEQALQ